MSHDEHAQRPTTLPTRRPQTSPEARTDATLRMSETLDRPKAHGCRDTELMRRLLAALHAL